MPVPVIDALPPAPQPTDTPPSVFVTKAAAQVAAQAVMVGQINTAISFIDGRAASAEAAAELSTTKASAASLSATAAGDAAVIAIDKAAQASSHKDAAATSAASVGAAAATANAKASESVAARDQAVAAAASAQAIALGVSTGRPSIRPTLLLDIANSGYVDTRVTVARSGVSTVVNRLGRLEACAANVCRINHDPLTLARRGLLIERPKTNLLLQSENTLVAPWSQGFVNGAGGNFYTVSTSTTVGDPYSPTGSAMRYQTAAAGIDLFARQTVALSAGVVYAGSHWIYVPSQAGVTSWRLRCDASDVETGTSAYSSVFDRWVRVSAKLPALAAARTFFDFGMLINGTDVAPPVGFVFYADCFQCEDVDTSSYIPTTTAQVERPAESPVISLANLAGVYRPDEGTFVVEFDVNEVVPYTYSRVVSFNGGNNANEITILLHPGTLKAYSAIYAGGVSQFDTGGTTNGNAAITANSLIKAALRFKSGSHACSMNGGGVQTGTGSVPAITQLNFGSLNGGSFLNGHLRRFALYSAGGSNAELQALAAL